MMELPTTDSIMQIVAHHDSPSSYDIFLMAVGYTSNYPNPTCVVELTKPVGGPYDTIWTLNIVQPSCTETYEYLTDIVLTENHVTVASKLEYADDGLDGDTDPTHYLFRLHEAKRNGFYNTILPLPSPSNVYQYDVSAYGVGIGCHHKGNAIRLCPMDHLDLTCFNWGDHSFTMLDPQESTEEYCVWMLSFHDSNFKARKAAIEPATCEAEIICTKELEQ